MNVKKTDTQTPDVLEPVENPFVDVPEGAYYTAAVRWAAEKGITSGTSKTTFSPDAVVTREQTVTFLWRLEGRPGFSSVQNPFSDVQNGMYYTSAVLWAVENGITNGTDRNSFSPKNNCKRGEIVTFLYRDLVEHL